MSDVKPLPQYKVAQVRALKIASIETEQTDAVTVSVLLNPSENGYKSIRVDGDYWKKWKPKVGGYYVVNDSGHESFCSEDSFESEYTRI